MPRQTLSEKGSSMTHDIARYVLDQGLPAAYGELRGREVEIQDSCRRVMKVSVLGKFEEGENITSESTSKQAPELSIWLRPEGELPGIRTRDYNFNGEANGLSIQESGLEMDVSMEGKSGENAQRRYNLLLNKVHSVLYKE